MEPSIPPVNTVSHGSQMEGLSGKGRGLELSTKPSMTRGLSINTEGEQMEH